MCHGGRVHRAGRRKEQEDRQEAGGRRRAERAQEAATHPLCGEDAATHQEENQIHHQGDHHSHCGQTTTTSYC